METRRPELAFEELAGVRHAAQGTFGDAACEPVALRDLFGGERAMGARVAMDEIAERVADRGQECGGNARRQRGAERVAIAARVFDGDVAWRAGDDDREHPPLAYENLDRSRDIGGRRPLRELIAREVTKTEEEIVHAVGRAGPKALVEALELTLELREDRGVEQLAQL